MTALDKTSMPQVDSNLQNKNIIEWIRSRRSIGNLIEPAPNLKEIETAIECAMTAPDHKKLQPWRFVVTQGDKRHDLGKALLSAAKAEAARHNNTLKDATKLKTLNMPLRAPAIVTVITNIRYHEKVPAFEQLLSAGAAVQNLLLAFKAMGYGTVWRTGPLANEPAVKSYFNVSADDYITAFVYVGTSDCEMPTRDDIDISNFTKFES